VGKMDSEEQRWKRKVLDFFKNEPNLKQRA
jgi:hypothetical protein